MEAKNLTSMDLAQRTGLSRSHIARLAAGGKIPAGYGPTDFISSSSQARNSPNGAMNSGTRGFLRWRGIKRSSPSIYFSKNFGTVRSPCIAGETKTCCSLSRKSSATRRRALKTLSDRQNFALRSSAGGTELKESPSVVGLNPRPIVAEERPGIGVAGLRHRQAGIVVQA